LRGTHAASARAWLREANAERWHFIFPYESAIFSKYQNIEGIEIYGCALFWYLQKACRCALAASYAFCGPRVFESEIGTGQRHFL